jgi:secreted trypsin-like serine protease
MRFQFILVLFILIFIEFCRSSESCGDRSGFQPSIVGGNGAQKGDWPWISAFFYIEKYFCSGSLISKQHILGG